MEEQLTDIGSKLDCILRLLASAAAARVSEGGGKQVDQIAHLGRAGLSATLIADVLDTTRNTVSVALSKNRSQPKRKRKA